MQSEGLQLPARNVADLQPAGMGVAYPGRRFALPWAVVCQPSGLWRRCPISAKTTNIERPTSNIELGVKCSRQCPDDQLGKLSVA